MNMAFSKEVLGPLQEFSATVETEWPVSLSEEYQKNILKLTNLVLENEDTIIEGKELIVDAQIGFDTCQPSNRKRIRTLN